MIQTNNLFPLPFYPANPVEAGIAYWQSKKWWAGKIYPLYYPTGYLPPFQCSHFGEVIEIKILSDKGVELYRINDPSLTQPANFVDIGGVLVHYGNSIEWSQMPEGRYYMQICTDDEDNEFCVSEIWTAVGDIKSFLKLEWWDDEDFVTEQGTIIYDGTYRNRLYVAAELAKPEYVFDEDGEERDGYFYPEKMLSTKRYHFSFLAPEYLLDALRFVRLSDHVTLTVNATVPVGITAPQIVYNCDSFLLTPEWVEAGDLATVSVEFTAGTVAKKIARL